MSEKETKKFDKKTEKLLGQISVAANVDVAFTEEIYLEKIAEVAEDANSPTEDELKSAIYQLTTALKAHVRSKAVPCEGIIIGNSVPFDWNTGNKNLQKKALDKILDKQNSEEITQEVIDALLEAPIKFKNKAVGKGLCLEESTPETGIIWKDIKYKNAAGKENKNFGKAWPPAASTTIMNIFGLGKVSDSESGLQKFSITVSGSDFFKAHPGINNMELIGLDIKPFKAFNAKLIHKEDASDENKIAFNLSTVTEFKYEDADLDIIAICKKAIPDHVKSVTDLNEYYEKYGDSREDFCIFPAGVQRINMDLSPIGNRKLWVDDPEMSPLDMFTDDGIVDDTVIEVPEAVDIKFARGSRIIVAGTVSKRPVWVRGEGNEPGHQHATETELTVNALSLYPMPLYTIPIPEEKEEIGGTDIW